MKKLFEIGDWVGTEDGFGQVLFNRPIHVEKYNKKDGKEKVGTHMRNLYVCKVLCDLQGKPKRVFKTSIYSSLNKLSDEKLTLIKDIKQNSPETYEKYLLSENKKILQYQTFVAYGLFDIDTELLKTQFLSIKDKLPYEFTFKEFEKIFNKENMPFNILEYIQYGCVKPQGSTKLTIRFDSDLYKVRNKEFIFKNFRVFIEHSPLIVLL